MTLAELHHSSFLLPTSPVDVFHFATAELHHSSFLLLTSPVGTQARRRLEFLDSLDRLATTAATTEKQMHTALQNNLWVFGPEYSLMASNRQLRTIIEDYIGPDATDLPDLFLAGNVLKRHLLIEFKKPTLTVGRDAESQAKKVADTLTGKLGMPLEILIIGGEVDAKLVAGYTGKETKFASYRAVIASAKTQLEWLIAELTTKD